VSSCKTLFLPAPQMGIPQKKEKNLKIWEAENSMHMKKEICHID
jgi:hypothetical protein